MMGMDMTTDMTNDSQSVLRLMTWLSPVFPTGGFSYSHGLESAIDDEYITNREDLSNWLQTLVAHGSIWNDCVLLVESGRQIRHTKNVDECAQLACSMAGSYERHLESTAQGRAFIDASGEWMDIELPVICPLSVAVGAVASANDISFETTLIAFLQAFVSNQVQSALRLMALGQKNGVWVQKQLEDIILLTAKRAANSSLDDLGSATVIAEITSMRHETLLSRIFRS